MPVQVSTLEDGHIVVIALSGKLRNEDYEHFVPEVEKLVAQHGKISMLMDMHDFHGWDMAALWEDTKFAMRHFKDIDRIAMVGEKAWHKGMAKFCVPFTMAQVRYFDHSQYDQAQNWLVEAHSAAKPND